MNPLIAALKEKYGAPEKALEALGLSPSLLAADQGTSDPLLKALARTPKMKLNATAARVLAALQGVYAPALAADAKPDFLPAVKGLTKANLGTKRADVLKRAKVCVKGMLANDVAGPDDVVMRLLDQLHGESPAVEATPEEMMEGDPGAAGGDPAGGGKPMAPPAEGGAAEVKPEADDDEDPEAEQAMLAKLTEALGGDADLAAKCHGIMKTMGAAKDETVPNAGVPPTKEKPLEGGGKPNEPRAEDDEPMTMPAMDAAIKSAIATAKAEAKAAVEARAFVRPWVGEVSLALDSATEIERHTLEALNVKTKGIHPSAFRELIKAQRKPGSDAGSGRARVAMDEAPSRKGTSSRWGAGVQVMR